MTAGGGGVRGLNSNVSSKRVQCKIDSTVSGLVRNKQLMASCIIGMQEWLSTEASVSLSHDSVLCCGMDFPACSMAAKRKRTYEFEMTNLNFWKNDDGKMHNARKKNERGQGCQRQIYMAGVMRGKERP